MTLAVVGAILARDERLDRQWRWVWFSALAACVGAMLLVVSGVLAVPTNYAFRRDSLAAVVVAGAWFVLCLVQIQVGVKLQSSFLVNLGIAGIALNLITTYLQLIVSMAQTGLMFVVSGVLLIGLGVYLEKKRRALLHRFQSPASPPPASAPS